MVVIVCFILAEIEINFELLTTCPYMAPDDGDIDEYTQTILLTTLMGALCNFYLLPTGIVYCRLQETMHGVFLEQH